MIVGQMRTRFVIRVACPTSFLRRRLAIAAPSSSYYPVVKSLRSYHGGADSYAVVAVPGCPGTSLRIGTAAACHRSAGTEISTRQTCQFGTSSYRRAAEGNAAAETTAAQEDGGGGDEGGAKEDHFDDPRVSILEAALHHIDVHGFSATALAAGATDCGFHAVATGMFPEGGAELVHHVMAKSLQEVKNLSDKPREEEEDKGGATNAAVAVNGDASGGDSSDEHEGDERESVRGQRQGPGRRGDEEEAVSRLRGGMKASLSYIARYKNHWPQAMSLGALPGNAGTTATAVAVLADELAFLSGDRSTDLSWYGKRGLIAGIYASTELFMLTDDSEGLEETWAYLDRRLSDYETLVSSPDNIGDVVTGVSTVATSLSSAAVSLAGPFLKQASKQVPGGETLAQTAPNVGALVSQALSFVASQVPHGGSSSNATESGAAASDLPTGSATTTSSSSRSDHKVDSESTATGQPQTYPGAPERDPWSDTPGSGTSKTGKFEEELAQEERELFGGDGKGKGDGEGQPRS